MTTSPRWRTALASAASAAVLVAAPLMGATTAHAQQPCPAYPAPTPHVTVDPTRVPAGGTVGFVGTCFFPDQLVIAELHSTEVVLGRFRADEDGTVVGTVRIPKRTERGEHIFELEGRHPRLEAFASIEVTRKKKHHGGKGHHGGKHNGGKGHNDGKHNGGKGHHKGEHDGKGHNDGKGRGEYADYGSDRSAGAPGSEEHRASLAHTGSEKALALGGTAAGLLAAGGGAMMAVRRRRSS